MRSTDRIQTLSPLAAGLILAIAVVSYQTIDVPPNATAAKPAPQARWVKVSSQPPTYYPRGIPADCPTDHWSGEWVETGDEKGTRYFIPLHGLGERREALVDDALSARSERKLAVIEAEDREILKRNIRNQVLFGPPAYAGLLLAAHAGATSYAIDSDRLQREWITSKQPH